MFYFHMMIVSITKLLNFSPVRTRFFIMFVLLFFSRQ